MIHATENFKSVKREPLVWRVPFFILAKLLLFVIGGGAMGQVVFKMFGLAVIGTWILLIGSVVTIMVMFYFRSKGEKLTIIEISRFTRNLKRIKEIA